MGTAARLYRSEPFVVDLERFQGPLDLLLHLIRAQDIDIFDIPISRITAQFQTVLEERIESLPLERAGEFLEMAATLIRIKAQLLLPGAEEPEWEEDPRAELVRRLLEYEHFQDVIHVLSAAEAQRSRHYPKGFIEPRPVKEEVRRDVHLTREEFLTAAAAIPDPLPPVVHRLPRSVVSVDEKISLVRRLLAGVKRLAFGRLVQPWGTRIHVVASLLACLELARRQLIRVDQVSPFTEIWLRSRADGSGAGGEEAP